MPMERVNFDDFYMVLTPEGGSVGARIVCGDDGPCVLFWRITARVSSSRNGS